MKERPIIFSAPMVRSILSGRKTQTRRVVKQQPCPAASLSRDAMAPPGYAFVHGLYDDQILSCPYGTPGDRIWVRETWHTNHDQRIVHYRADYPGGDPLNVDECGDDHSLVGEKWRPSIYMPRWASRITLDVTGVRVERLKDISEDDARAEGLVIVNEDDAHLWYSGCSHPSDWPNGFFCEDPIAAYRDLWASINGPGSWDANPWVWVIEFERTETAATTTSYH